MRTLRPSEKIADRIPPSPIPSLPGHLFPPFPHSKNDDSSSGEASDAQVNANSVMSPEETLALAALTVLLVAVLGERARRGWERRRLAGEETA